MLIGNPAPYALRLMTHNKLPYQRRVMAVSYRIYNLDTVKEAFLDNDGKQLPVSWEFKDCEACSTIKMTMSEILQNAEAAGALNFIERHEQTTRPNHSSTIIVGEGEGRRTRNLN